MTASVSRARVRSVAVALTATVAVTSGTLACSSGETDDDSSPAVEARVLPPISAPGPDARSADQAEVVVEGVVSPVDAGSRVTLQVRRGGTWSDLDTADQDDDGGVDFTAPYLVDGKPQTYRLLSGDTTSTSVGTGQWADQLAFDDGFDGVTLGPYWNQRVQGYGEVEARSCSRSTPEMLKVAGGVAAMSVALDPAQAGQCEYDGDSYGYRMNANIGTEGLFSFTYGFAAARMRFHRDRGQHAAFWMQPADPSAVGGAEEAGAEIDVIEWFGDKHPSGGLATYIHYDDDSGERVKAGGWIEDPEQYGDDWWRKYHVYSVEWTADRYVFRIDGRVVNTLTEGVSGVPQALILSNLSSDYELQYLPAAGDLPQTTDVDWVRVWSPSS